MKKYVCIKDYHSSTDIINSKNFKIQEFTIKAGDTLIKINNLSNFVVSTQAPYIGLYEYVLRKNSEYFSFLYEI